MVQKRILPLETKEWAAKYNAPAFPKHRNESSYKEGHMLCPTTEEPGKSGNQPWTVTPSVLSLTSGFTNSLNSVFYRNRIRGESHVEFSHHVFSVACNLDSVLWPP